MHPAVRDWVRTHTKSNYLKVLEVGSRDINGGVRDLIAADFYHGVDLYPGPGVDQVANARNLEGRYDLVACLEVLEHDPDASGLIQHLGRLCAPGGLVVATAGGPGREPHSAHDGAGLRDGEHYRNLDELHFLVAWGEVVACQIADTDWRVVWRKFG